MSEVVCQETEGGPVSPTCRQLATRSQKKRSESPGSAPLRLRIANNFLVAEVAGAPLADQIYGSREHTSCGRYCAGQLT